MGRKCRSDAVSQVRSLGVARVLQCLRLEYYPKRFLLRVRGRMRDFRLLEPALLRSCGAD